MTNISVTGAQFVVALAGIVLLILMVIYFMRSYLKKQGTSHISSISNDVFSLISRNKYPNVNAFKWSGTFFNLGLAVSIGIVALALGLTQYEKPIFIPDGALDMDDDIEIEIPRTKERKELPPPPPPSKLEEVPEEEIIDEEPEFVDQSIDDDSFVEEAPFEEKKVAPPPPPPMPEPKEEEIEEIFISVQQMPRFPGCENVAGGKAEKQKCSDEQLLKFIYKNINYPPIARENNIQGNVYLRFIVQKDGSIGNVELIKDIGGGCGTEALRVVNLMNKQGIKWTPGKQQGRPVKVQFNLPIKFRLQ